MPPHSIPGTSQSRFVDRETLASDRLESFPEHWYFALAFPTLSPTCSRDTKSPEHRGKQRSERIFLAVCYPVSFLSGGSHSSLPVSSAYIFALKGRAADTRGWIIALLTRTTYALRRRVMFPLSSVLASQRLPILPACCPHITMRRGHVFSNLGQRCI